MSEFEGRPRGAAIEQAMEVALVIADPAGELGMGEFPIRQPFPER